MAHRSRVIREVLDADADAAVPASMAAENIPLRCAFVPYALPSPKCASALFGV